MARYIRQFFSLLDTICKKIVQLIFARQLHQPGSSIGETYSFTEIIRNPTNQRDTEQIETIPLENTINHDRQSRNNQRKSKRAKAKKRKVQRNIDAQCKLPEDFMIEHLEDHRDGIGWSIAALAKKRFHIRRTLKSNDPNGDMFCEVDDNGELLLRAVKQLISEHDRLNENK
jgi:ABC-type lipopolysaccharide export system ATPase subunit